MPGEGPAPAVRLGAGLGRRPAMLARLAADRRRVGSGRRSGRWLWCKRKPAVAALAAAVVLAVVGGTTGIIAVQAKANANLRVERDKAIAAERQTAIERDKAIAAEAKSKAINEFLTQDLLTQAEPENSAAEDHVTLLEVLDRAAEKVGKRFADQPELESALRDTIHKTYHGLASWAKAETQLRPCWRQHGSATRSPPRSTTTRASWLTSSDTGGGGTRRSSRWPSRPPRDSTALWAPHTRTPWPRLATSP